MTVDAKVARWHPGADTVDRLKSMAAKCYQPQDAGTLEGYRDQLAACAKSAEEILHEAVTVVALRGHRCPACNADSAPDNRAAARRDRAVVAPRASFRVRPRGKINRGWGHSAHPLTRG